MSEIFLRNVQYIYYIIFQLQGIIVDRYLYKGGNCSIDADQFHIEEIYKLSRTLGRWSTVIWLWQTYAVKKKPMTAKTVMCGDAAKFTK